MPPERLPKTSPSRDATFWGRNERNKNSPGYWDNGHAARVCYRALTLDSKHHVGLVCDIAIRFLSIFLIYSSGRSRFEVEIFCLFFFKTIATGDFFFFLFFQTVPCCFLGLDFPTISVALRVVNANEIKGWEMRCCREFNSIYLLGFRGFLKNVGMEWSILGTCVRTHTHTHARV